jgi:hypothetical protein
MGKDSVTIVAFAGRRIDATDAETPRFPLTQVNVVHKKIEELFRRDKVKTLICSAACGADLIALRVAQKLRIGYRIVLPFAPERFRITSVMDRPCTQEWNWGVLFHLVIDIAQEKGELVVVETDEDSQTAYQAVNHAILNEALQQGRIQADVSTMEPPQEIHEVQAVITWDGHARGPRDLTLHFAEEARSRGLVVKEILTLP